MSVAHLIDDEAVEVGSGDEESASEVQLTPSRTRKAKKPAENIEEIVEDQTMEPHQNPDVDEAAVVAEEDGKTTNSLNYFSNL